MMKRKCETCEFFDDEKHSGLEQCHRYPETTSVEPGHWCGEWVDKDQALPTYQSRPVFVGVADKVVNP